MEVDADNFDKRSNSTTEDQDIYLTSWAALSKTKSFSTEQNANIGDEEVVVEQPNEQQVSSNINNTTKTTSSPAKESAGSPSKSRPKTYLVQTPVNSGASPQQQQQSNQTRNSMRPSITTKTSTPTTTTKGNIILNY